MKSFVPTLVAGTLVACAFSPTVVNAQDRGYAGPSYSKYQTGNYADSSKNSELRKWSTAQLQERRKELYKTVPQGQTRHGNPYYVYHGDPLPQQQEILAIEAELKRRFDKGDKSASLDRPIPGGIHP